MRLADKRRIITEIYAEHDFVILKWTGPLRVFAVSTIKDQTIDQERARLQKAIKEVDRVIHKKYY